jgi:hypothetical protein
MTLSQGVAVKALIKRWKKARRLVPTVLYKVKHNSLRGVKKPWEFTLMFIVKAATVARLAHQSSAQIAMMVITDTSKPRLPC